MSNPGERQVRLFGVQFSVPPESKEGTNNEKLGASNSPFVESGQSIVNNDFVAEMKEQDENITLPNLENQNLNQCEESQAIEVPKAVEVPEAIEVPQVIEVSQVNEEPQTIAAKKDKGKTILQNNYSDDDVYIVEKNNEEKKTCEICVKDEAPAYSESGDDELFNNEELSGIVVTDKRRHFVQVDCGCTNKKYGDYVGKLNVYRDGKLEISCACNPNCDIVNVKPKLFEEHAGHTNGSRWKTRIWVMVNGVKKSLEKTVLLKYFYGSPSDPRSKRKRQGDAIRFHNDEFIACSVCGKKRRFSRRTLEQCRLYHDADLAKAEWTCLDYPHDVFNCESKDERKATEMMRGCPADPHCTGCLRCVCFGCSACRFKDCACQTCTDYIHNADLDAPSTSKKARRTSKKAPRTSKKAK